MSASITNLIRKKLAEQPRCPALDALRALRARLAALQADDAQWAEREHAAAADIRVHDEARAEVENLRARYIDACAERELRPAAKDPSGLALLLDEAQARTARLHERRQVAERLHAKICNERAGIRAEQQELGRQHASAVHAAAVERMNELAADFLAAERAYLDALAAVFGAATLADRVARDLIAARQPHPGFVDSRIEMGRIFTPRPAGAAFQPVPQRPDIATAIAAASAALEKEILA